MQGDGTVTYEDPFSAASAVEWFNGKEFKGMLHEYFNSLEVRFPFTAYRESLGVHLRLSGKTFIEPSTHHSNPKLLISQLI